MRRELSMFDVVHVRDHGWAAKLNGELLRAADAEFDVLVTVDRGFAHQQNLADLHLAVVILVSVRNSMRFLRPLLPELVEVLDSIRPGEVIHVPRPGAI
jgi:hypothetical protein